MYYRTNFFLLKNFIFYKNIKNQIVTEAVKEKFFNAYRQDVKVENPDLKPSQITKLLKEEWTEMDDSDKKDWSEEEQE